MTEAIQTGPPAVDMEAQVAALAAASGVDVDVVRQLVTVQTQQAGEPVGTVRIAPVPEMADPLSVAVAHRVLVGGIPQWRVSHPTDGVFYELSPTKADWTLVER